MGRLSVDTCRQLDSDADDLVSIAEVIHAVNHALNGCP